MNHGWKMVSGPKRVSILLTSYSDGKEWGKRVAGRSFISSRVSIGIYFSTENLVLWATS